MEEGFMEPADKLSGIIEEAYPAYEFWADTICQGNATQDEVEHLLDKLLDLAYDDKYLMLYKMYAEDMCMNIRSPLNSILIHTEKCGIQTSSRIE